MNLAEVERLSQTPHPNLNTGKCIGLRHGFSMWTFVTCLSHHGRRDYTCWETKLYAKMVFIQISTA
jgi:hypothetical protein